MIGVHVPVEKKQKKGGKTCQGHPVMTEKQSRAGRDQDWFPRGMGPGRGDQDQEIGEIDGSFGDRRLLAQHGMAA